MATCPNCGNDLTGPYCDMCGARRPEERPRRSRKEAPRTESGPPAGGGAAARRVSRATALGLLGVLIYAAGIITGFFLAGTDGTTSAASGAASEDAADLQSLPPLARASRYMDQGVTYLEKGERTAAASELRKAAAEFQSVLSQEPDHLYARTYLGLIYYYLGDTKKAVETEQAVLAKDPNYLWAIFNLAWIQEVSNQPAEAMRLYQRYLDVAPAEKENRVKYAEQYELIDQQIQAAQQALSKLKEGSKQ
jgi:tetratricopeptide (TPR) repeat protein